MIARTLAASLSLLVLGCARPKTEPTQGPTAGAPARAGASAQPVVHGGELPWPDAAACAAAARTTPGDPAVDQALRTIVGGHYSPDHLGPEAFAAIEAHVRREPDAFLDALGRAALDPAAPLDLHWANVLVRTASARPARTRELAACLLARFDAGLAQPPAARDPSWEDRIEGHRLDAYLAWRGRPDDGTWRIAVPSSACTTTAGGTTTLTVAVACTCGEPIACDIAASPAGIDVLVTLDPRAPAMCRDCYPGAGTCTLPSALDDAGSLTINGLRMPLVPCGR